MKKSYETLRLAVFASSLALFSTLTFAIRSPYLTVLNEEPTVANTPSDGSILNQRSPNADSIVTTQTNSGKVSGDNHTFGSSGAINANIIGANGAQSSTESGHGVGVNVAAVTAVTTSLQTGMMNSSGASVGSTVNVGNVGGETGNASSNAMNISNKTITTPGLK